jgi:uncharacterized membrane protein YdfJ with MMPL/SSD domain
VYELLEFGKHQSKSNFYTSCTGLFPLFAEMSEATESSFATIDATVIPLAILILGCNLQSYRHMLVALINLLCTILLAFTILYGISISWAINPFTPTIVLSLGVAICFDYCLFMMARYREDYVENKETRVDAVLLMLQASGHVVLLSGITLLASFLLLLAFPQDFLQSVGWGCSAVVVAALVTNLSITPCLLLMFDCLSTFESFPSCLCLFQSSVPVSNSHPVPGQELANIDPAVAAETPSVPEEPGVLLGQGVPVTSASSQRVVKIEPRNRWFHIAAFTTRYSSSANFLALAIAAPFLWQFLKIQPTSDHKLIYLRGSRSLDGYDIMQSYFPVGQLDPYMIIMASDTDNAVMTPDYFDAESELIAALLETQSSYMDTRSVTALSFFDGNSVEFSTAMSYFHGLDSPIANSYRLKVGGLLNEKRSASLIRIETTVNPNSEAVVDFIRETRVILDHRSASSTPIHIRMYLFGGYTTTLDVQGMDWLHIVLQHVN